MTRIPALFFAASRILSPPEVGDQDLKEQARLLNTLLLACLVVTAVLSIAHPLIAPEQHDRLIIILPLPFLMLGIQLVLSRGYVRLAGLLLTGTVWLALMAATITGGGLQSFAFPNFILVVLIAGYVLGRRIGIAVAALSALIGLALVFAETRDMLDGTPNYSSMALWLLHTLVFFVVAVLLNFATLNLEIMLGRARSSEQVAEKRSRELEHQAVTLGQVNRAYQMLSGCNQAVVRAAEESALLSEVCRTIVEVGGYRLAWIGYAEKDDTKLVRPVAQYGYEEGYLKTIQVTWSDTERGRGPTGTAIRMRKPTVARNLLTETGYAPWRGEAAARGYASSIALPLPVGDTVLGAISIYAQEPDAFDDEEVELLTKLAGDLAYGISALRTSAERRAKEAALRENEEYFRSLIENAQDIITVLDTSAVIRFVSPSSEAVLGYLPAELIGRNVFDFIPEADQSKVMKALAGGYNDPGRVQSAEHRFRQKDGSWRILESIGSVHLYGENQAQAVINSRDVTDRKRAQKELQESEERFRALVDHSPFSTVIYASDGRPLRFNQAAVDLWRLADHDLEQFRQAYNILNDEQLASKGALSYMKRSFRGETAVTPPIKYEFLRHDENGAPIEDERWIIGRSYPIKNAAGDVQEVVVVHEDISELKRAGEAERQQREFAEALASTTATLNSTLKLTEVLDRILDGIQPVLKHDSSNVMLIENGIAQVVRSRGGDNSPGSHGRDRLVMRLPVAQTRNLRQMYDSEQALVIPDVQEYPGWVTEGSPQVDWIRSHIGAPIRQEGKVIGFLNLDSATPGFFNEDHADRLQAFADQAGAAIRNARLFELARKRAEQLEALRQATLDITRQLDLDTLLDALARSALALLDVQGGGLYLYRPERDVLEWQMAVGDGLVPIGTELRRGEGLSGKVWESGKPLLVDDYATWEGRAAIFNDYAWKAVLGVPIHWGDEFLGVICATDDDPSALTDDTLELLSLFAAQAAIAIKNARLLQATTEQAQQLEQILGTVQEGIILLDDVHCALLANPQGRRHLEALAGAQVGDIITHLGDHELSPLLESALNNRLTHDLVLSKPSRFFELEVASLKPGPQKAGWVLVLRERTEERERREYIRAQERLATVGQLAAGVAHDFNNIMAVISLYSGLILTTPDLSPKNRERLKTVGEQSERAASLISQILDFSRRSVMARTPIAFVPFLKELIKLLERTLPENIAITFEHDDEPFVVNADPTRLQQVLMNLSVNARDAMPEGGELRINLSGLYLEPNSRSPLPDMEAGDWLALSIYDNGLGIEPEHLPHVFEPFFTTKSPHQGTGLGLAQAYGIVKQHDGHIDVSSVAGRGTTFRIFLPVLKPRDTSPLKASSEGAEIKWGSGETILVVEDDQSTRAAIRDTLEMLQYRILEAANGEEALSLYDQNASEIVLVLSDLVMPGMGGRDLYHLLRQRHPGVKMVVTTGYPLEQDGKELLEQGIIGWLAKPFSTETVSEIVQRTLNA